MSCLNSALEEQAELNIPGVTYDDAFSVLSAPRARYLLAYLNAEGTRVDLEDVATDVATREHDCDPGELSVKTEERMLVSLYHTTAPKLADAGLVDFDTDELTIEITEAGAQLEDQSHLPAEQPS